LSAARGFAAFCARSIVREEIVVAIRGKAAVFVADRRAALDG
jgi:hypothetical protein